MNNSLVTEKTSINEAILKIQKNKIKLLLVCKEKKIIGSFNDGDLRRAIIKGAKKNNKILKYYNKNFFFTEKIPSENDIKNFIKKGVYFVPLLNKQKRLIKIFDFTKNQINIDKPEFKNNVFLIMAGGYGARLKPLTNNTPKPLLVYEGMPIIEKIIKKAKNEGFYRFYISTHYLHDKIKKFCRDGKQWGINIKYLHEKKPLGTAGCISKLNKDNIKNIIVCNADLNTDLDFNTLLNYHVKSDSDFTIGYQNINYDIPYGIIKTKNDELISISEKPSFLLKMNCGIYVIKKKVIQNLDIKKRDMNELINLASKKFKVRCFPIFEKLKDLGSNKSLFN